MQAGSTKPQRRPSKGRLCLCENLHGSASRFDVEFHRTDHILRFEYLVEFLLAEDAVFEHQLIHAATRFERLLGDFGRILIADDRIEGGNDADAVVHVSAAALLLCRNSVCLVDMQIIGTF